jgi:hypothetical protein
MKTSHLLFSLLLVLGYLTPAQAFVLIEQGREYYLTEKLIVRSGPSANHRKIGYLQRNDKVKIVSEEAVGELQYVEVVPTNSVVEFPEDAKLFVSANYLDTRKVKLSDRDQGYSSDIDYYIKTSNSFNLRNDPSTDNEVAGKVYKDNIVRIVAVNPDLKWARIVVIQTGNKKLDTSREYWIGTQALRDRPYWSFNDAWDEASFFIVQNVAAEMLRFYRKCYGYCPDGHEFISENEMVVGDPAKDRTWLGMFYIDKWVKFYEDEESHYAAWYNPNYPPIDFSKDKSSWWISDAAIAGTGSAKWRAANGGGEEWGGRGAFGWYAGLMGPGNHNKQWMHGTYGLGNDGDYFIKFARGETFLGSLAVSFGANLRSSGCSRMANPYIAYLQHAVPEGTPVLKVYAKEGMRSSASIERRYLSRIQIDGKKYQGMKFDWVLTATQGSATGQSVKYSSQRAHALKFRGSDPILEEGSYIVDIYPDPVPRDYSTADCEGKLRKVTGDIYCVGTPKTVSGSGTAADLAMGRQADGQFQGVFLVDEGRFINYQHPQHANITVGGYEKSLPRDVETAGAYTVPNPVTSSSNF